MIVKQNVVDADSCQLILRPNASLHPRQARWLVGMIGLLMATIGLGFAAFGAWPVLPFAGGELLLLIYALGYSMRSSAACEVITIAPDKIRIEQSTPGTRFSVEFSRFWARIDWLPGPCKRLVIGSHGKWVEIGAFLGEEEKQKLATTLQEQAGVSEF